MSKLSDRLHPTQRFSTRAENYKKHRPDYPEELVEILFEQGVLFQETIVADIGAGTGHLTKLLLPHARKVHAVEPNEAMRLEAEANFAGANNFISIGGTAEATGLPDHSIDLITVAQAFHWFDAEKTKREFRRIQKPRGFVALVWNVRDIMADEFQRQYNDILKFHIPHYKQTFAETTTDEHIFNFYGSADVEIFQLDNKQTFDLESLKGRLMSSSYSPKPSDPNFGGLMQDIEKLFQKFKRESRIRFIYKTKLYLGQLC